MKHLSGLDASFLHLETPEMPMHVGGLHLLELPAGFDGDFIDAVKRHIADRMHLAGVFTKKLALMPFDIANPVWVDDDDLDLDYHVRQVTLVKGAPGGLRVAAGLLVPERDEDGKRHIGWPKTWSMAPRTPLNVGITNQRVFATVSIAQKEASEIAKAFNGTLNDAVLCVVSGALRRYLGEHDALPGKPLVAALPISLRAEGNTDLNNQVSMMLLKLASDEDDVKVRMRTIVKASAAMKKALSNVKAIMPTDFPSLGLPWLMSGLVSLYGRSRLADMLPPIANVVVSNVPGPRVPLYLAGARMVSNYPVSIITHGLALNVTLQSYNGSLDFGLVACRRAMPDVRMFAACMSAAHEELLAAARALAAPAPAIKPARKRAARKAADAIVPTPAPAKRRPRTAASAA